MLFHTDILNNEIYLVSDIHQQLTALSFMVYHVLFCLFLSESDWYLHFYPSQSTGIWNHFQLDQKPSLNLRT